MAWSKPKGDVISLKDEKDGSQFIGTYTGKKVVQVQGKESIIWQFQDEEGVPFAIWGVTYLNRQMEGIVIGSNCRITYKGRSKTKNKYGKFPYLVDVEVETPDDGETVTAEDMPPEE